MRTLSLVAAFCLTLGVAGCGDTTASRSLSGGALGAAAGAGLGALGGNTPLGAAVGGAAGIIGGYLYDQHKKGNID